MCSSSRDSRLMASRTTSSPATSGGRGSRLKSDATSEPDWSPISCTSNRIRFRSCQSGTSGTRL